jgi:hypothetical protein
VRALDATEVEYRLNPLPRQLGQKYGARYPEIRRALLSLDPGSAAATLAEAGKVEVRVGDELLAVMADEIEVRLEPRAGFAVASDGPDLAALRTELTSELIEEGLAREAVRRIQELRGVGFRDAADTWRPTRRRWRHSERRLVTAEVHRPPEAVPLSRSRRTTSRLDGGAAYESPQSEPSPRVEWPRRR